MKVLLFTHKNDIDGMGNAVLAKITFDDVDYVLCGTFDLTNSVLSYYDSGKIYEYDKVFVTDLCLEEKLLERISSDDKLKGKVLNLDHHMTYMNERYTKYSFVKVMVSNKDGLCCGTSLFYEYLLECELIDKSNRAIKEFVELTRQHDTWEWKNIYNNEVARRLAVLFDVVGTTGYIELMVKKLLNKSDSFCFDEFEDSLINNRLVQIDEKMKYYSDRVIYRDILGMKAGIVFIAYEYRNELAQYFKDNNYDMDFVMMIAFDPGVCCYRSVKDNINVRKVAEHFGGKGHDKASSNPMDCDITNKIVDLLITV